jgi:hypothetical protein
MFLECYGEYFGIDYTKHVRGNVEAEAGERRNYLRAAYLRGFL